MSPLLPTASALQTCGVPAQQLSVLSLQEIWDEPNPGAGAARRLSMTPALTSVG